MEWLIHSYADKNPKDMFDIDYDGLHPFVNLQFRYERQEASTPPVPCDYLLKSLQMISDKCDE